MLNREITRFTAQNEVIVDEASKRKISTFVFSHSRQRFHVKWRERSRERQTKIEYALPISEARFPGVL